MTFLGLLLVTLTSVGQENPFLDRTYWRNNPTIADIDQKIAEGHDVSASTGAAFDAVSWALIEKTDNTTIKYLLSKKGNDVNKLTHDKRTYIFWAAYKDNLPMMQYLLDNGAKTDIIDSHGYSLMNFAAATGQLNTKIYNFCLEHGADPSKERNHDGANVLLLVAPYIKDTSLIEYFIKKGVNLRSTDNNGNGIFNYAAKAGNIQLMDYLIKQGLPYKDPVKDGSNAMIFASRGTRGVTNTLETFKYLERLGISPNVVTKNGNTPLHSIAYRGKDIDIFKYFLSKGVNINQADDQGNTPFLNAALFNKLEIVQYLSPFVSDLNIQNKEGLTALTSALRRNSVDVVTFLLEKGADVNVKDAKGNNLVYHLIRSYKSKNFDVFIEKIKLLAAKGLDITQHQKDGNSLFHLALETSDLKLLKWVDISKVDINVKNDEGLTALHKAAMIATDDVVLKYLLSIGADKNIKTTFEESAYDLATENELLQQSNTNIQFLKEP